jgi:4'-phosphopantetheinyl transferase EntD
MSKQTLKNAVTLLRKGKTVLENNHWCRNVLACDENGERVAVQSSHAHAFCALGAVYKAQGNTKRTARFKEAKELLDNAVDGYYCGVEGFNDGVAKRKRDVINLFNRAIKNGEEQLKDYE